MGLTPHCGRFCREKGWGKNPHEWHHYHATSRRKRFVKRHHRMQPYVRPTVGARPTPA